MENKNAIQLLTKGEVEINERKFTRVYGGFGQDKIVITDKQVAELLGHSKGARQVRETLEKNKKHFEENLHYIDVLKGVAQNDTLKETLISLGYKKTSITQAKHIYIFSEAGFLLFLKFAEGDKAVETYKNFIELYFITKAENESARKTLQEQRDFLMTQRKALMGEIIYAETPEDRAKFTIQDKELEKQIKSIDEELTKQKVLKHVEDKLTIADKFTSSEYSYDVGTFAKTLKIKGLGRNNMFQWLRDQEILRSNNEPYQTYIDYFNIIQTFKNGYVYSKTLINGKGIKFIVKKLISDNKLKSSYEETMNMLNDKLIEE